MTLKAIVIVCAVVSGDCAEVDSTRTFEYRTTCEQYARSLAVVGRKILFASGIKGPYEAEEKCVKLTGRK